MFQMEVQEPYYSFIKTGDKTVEGRLAKDKYLRIKKGDHIRINDTEVVVQFVHKYDTFDDMLRWEGFKNAIPEAESRFDAEQVYYKFYKPEDEETFGVLAIGIETVDNLKNPRKKTSNPAKPGDERKLLREALMKKYGLTDEDLGV